MILQRTMLDPRTIMEDLSTRQFLNPHATLGSVLRASAAALDFGDAADASVRWLGLAPGQAIGRLRRSEIAQLAQSIARFERETAAAETVGPCQRQAEARGIECA